MLWRSLFLISFALLSLAATNPFPYERWESGFVKIARGEKALHYYLFRCRNQSISVPPLLVWMDGGPGYSTAFGVWQHGGPYIVNNVTGKIEANPYAWNNFADVLFVDQPAGAVFSYANSLAAICTNESCVAKDFYEFLLNFKAEHAGLAFSRLYLSGVSYAGHYVPAIAGYILDSDAASNGISLKGIALFDGLIDLSVQLQAYPQFLYDNSLISALDFLYYTGMALVCKVSVYTLHIDLLTIPCAALMMTIFYKTGLDVDPSDITEKYGPNPYEETLKVYLNQPDVQRALGVNQKFVPLNESVTEALMEDFMLPLSPQLSLALTKGIKVTLTFGDKDYICNWIGGQWVADGLDWAGRTAFLAQQFHPWRGGVQAEYRKHNELTLAIVKGGGHSVFAKQRVVSGQILKALLYDETPSSTAFGL